MWTPNEPFPKRVADHFKSGGQIRAHNAAFDRLITWYVLCPSFDVPEPKLTSWYCTATQARANCYPGSLEDAGRFSTAIMKKDFKGSQLVRQLSIPRADGTFNYDPALLGEMANYCRQDVRAMRNVSKHMRQLTEEELLDYHINERINERGIRVDVPLAKAATAYAATELQDVEQLVQEITKGAITSVRSTKMKSWVLERVGEQAKKLMVVVKDGEEKMSVDKSVRANLLILADENADEVPPEVADVLQCASDIWASSVAKFTRMAKLADPEDQRVRGAFIFNGGSATGRVASYGLQLQNMARKTAKDPEAVRKAMLNSENLVPNFGKSVSEVLKGMIRPALLPAEGNAFVVLDWAAIEARVNPWLSKRPQGQEVLDVFRAGEDIYVKEAAKMFRVPEDKVTPEQRTIGKVAILACFTAETKVLTDNGVKAIVEVLLTDKLWDGKSWVTHQGVIPRGVKATVNVLGINVTPDHLFLVGTKWLEAKQLALSANIRFQALVTGSASLPLLGLKGLSTARALPTWLGFNVLVAQTRISLWITTFVKVLQQGVMFALKNSLGIGLNNITAMPILFPMTPTDVDFLIEYPLASIDATTQTTKDTHIMAAGVFLYTSFGEKIEKLFYPISLHWKDGTRRILNWTEQTLIKGMNQIICGSLLDKLISKINVKFQKCNKKSLTLKPVYDILNSGTNHRFTVVSNKGALIAHNCGYGGGVGAFSNMGRNYGILLPEGESKATVDKWRTANKWAVQYWKDTEEAYFKAMRFPIKDSFVAGRVGYYFDSVHLWYSLPSGRLLCYPFARFDDDGGISYAKSAWKPESDAKEWSRARLWAGIAVENVCQATANDLLRYILRQIDDVVLTAHDEILIECKIEDAPARLEQAKEIMCTPPAWCQDLPLAVEGKILMRYGK